MKFTTNQTLETQFLGCVDYNAAFEIQTDLAEIAKSTNKNFLLGLEHPAVITLGHRAVIGEQVKQSSSLPIIKSTRGGLATVHSEGQLVIYPIINLKRLNWGIRDYVSLLLSTTVETILEFGIKSKIDSNNVGVYTEAGKIAFCGVHVKNGVSIHGISLNISNDLTYFQEIISCGVSEPALDRLINYVSIAPDLNEVFEKWDSNFRKKLIKS